MDWWAALQGLSYFSGVERPSYVAALLSEEHEFSMVVFPC